MQLRKLFVGASTLIMALLLLTGTFLISAVPASATGGTVTQGTPTSGATTVDNSSAFSDQLSAAGDGSTVDYTTLVSDTGINVSSTGAVTTTGTLAQGTYSASGTDADQDSDAGTWSYTLSVAASTITQVSPTSAATTASESAAFADQLNVTGNNGAVTFSTSSPSPELTVSSSGAVTTNGQLAEGDYSASGTDTDADGDAGVWSYTLAVASGAIAPGGQALVQTSATTGATTTSGSATFVPPAIAVSGSIGAVIFTTTTSSTGLQVASGGVISVTGTLAAGSYTVSGTDHDASGDVGTWTYTLTVTNGLQTVNFEPNGGTGTMAAQTEDQPTPLTLNKFTRAGYTFVDWFTSANGTGTPYANGASYSFATSITLYAQWKEGKSVYHQVTFFANGGRGSMAAERENTPTGLTNVTFTRKGYTFAGWNSKAGGKGKSFNNRATYSFRSSLSLYAQWKKVRRAPIFTVTFAANGGKGVMASETGNAPAALTQEAFTRAGYTFVDWNTGAKGSGATYANRADYSFGANVTLYAQWKKIKKAVPPPPPITYGGLILGPFASGSSALTPGLESQIRDLAETVKSRGKSEIALHGFGDNLSGANDTSATNVGLGRARAQVVASYLAARLSALGVKGWSISVEATGATTTRSGQIDSAQVSVTLS
jgi:uncharacterized repeat protein (TIGR02543 family)